MKEPLTALFLAQTGVGKTHLALSLLENEYRNHFDFMVIICPTLRYNSTYKSRGSVWNDRDVIPIEPGNQLYYLIEKISNLLTGSVTLFLIDDIIAYETLDKRRQPLLELVLGQKPLDKTPLDINPQTKTPWTKNPLAKNPQDKNPPDKTFLSEIL